MAQVATNVKTLRAWEFTNSETGEDSVFNGCFPSFGPFRTTPEFCRIQNQFWVAEPQPVFALARYDAAAPKAFGAGASDWNRTSDLGLMSPTL